MNGNQTVFRFTRKGPNLSTIRADRLSPQTPQHGGHHCTAPFHFKRGDLIIHCLQPRGGFSCSGVGGFLQENKISRLKFHQKGARCWRGRNGGEKGEWPRPLKRPNLTRRTAIVKLSRSCLRFHQLANVRRTNEGRALRDGLRPAPLILTGDRSATFDTELTKWVYGVTMVAVSADE